MDVNGSNTNGTPSKPGYEQLGPGKPPPHYYVKIKEVPEYPHIDGPGAAAIFLSEEWQDRSVRYKTIHSLQDLVRTFIECNRDLATYPQIHLSGVVIHDATLSGLCIPFDIFFDDALFLNGFNIRSCDLKRLVVRGKIAGQMSLVGVGGRSAISLENAEVDGLHIYDVDIEMFSSRGTAIGSLCIGKMDGETRLSIHECVVQDAALIGEIPNACSLWFSETQFGNAVNLNNVNVCRSLQEKKIAFYNCKLARELVFRNTACLLLDLKGSQCTGQIDLRGLTFETIDVLGVEIEGQLLLREEQLRSNQRCFRLWPGAAKYDTPSRVVGDGADDDQSRHSVIDQLFLLRESFHKLPSLVDLEDYCAYRMMEATRKPSGRRIWDLVRKYLLGYMIVTERILLTGLLAIILLVLVYGIFTGIGFGTLLQTNDTTGVQESVFKDGIVVGLGRSLYFTTITFTTVGYGDMHPTGALKAVAMINALLGLLLASTFIASLVRRVYRW